MDYIELFNKVRKKKLAKLSEMAAEIGISVHSLRQWRVRGKVRALTVFKIETYLDKQMLLN